MFVTRFALLAFVVSLLLGAALAAPAEASSFVKRGVSGTVYHWTSGC